MFSAALWIRCLITKRRNMKLNCLLQLHLPAYLAIMLFIPKYRNNFQSAVEIERGRSEGHLIIFIMSVNNVRVLCSTNTVVKLWVFGSSRTTRQSVSHSNTLSASLNQLTTASRGQLRVTVLAKDTLIYLFCHLMHYMFHYNHKFPFGCKNNVH